MKKLTLTTEKVLAAFNVLSTAKYSKLDDADKIKVWKITRAMKPVADKFADDRDDAARKLMPTEDFEDRRIKAQKYPHKRIYNRFRTIDKIFFKRK